MRRRRAAGLHGLAAVEAGGEGRVVVPSAAGALHRPGHSPISPRPGPWGQRMACGGSPRCRMPAHAHLPRVPAARRGRRPLLRGLRRGLRRPGRGGRRPVRGPDRQREVQGRGDDRPGGHGEGLPGPSPDAGPAGGPEDAPPHLLRRSADLAALPARGPRRLPAQPPQLDRGARLRRRRGRDALHGHGVPARARPRAGHLRGPGRSPRRASSGSARRSSRRWPRPTRRGSSTAT